MHPPAKLLLLLAGVVAVLLAASSHVSAACTPQERDALLAFKRGYTSDSDTAGLLASWRKDDDCCHWRGVRCSNRTGHAHAHVVALNLRGQGLAGEISPSLLSLPHLEHLDLSNNSLTGRIPGFLGSLRNLRYLNLSHVEFSPGEVPPHFGNLSKLHYLDLSTDLYTKNNLSSKDLSWLTRLRFLRYLNLDTVDLSTVADWPHVVNALPSLRSLHLFGCALISANQSLPQLNLSTTLEELDLSRNNFHHPVASCWFWNLTRLKHLYLEYNYGLYGQLPDALGGMVSLQELSLSGGNNMMSMGSADLKNLCNLRFLYLDNCFSGIKAERLPQCSSNRLQELSLLGNQLTGTLADWMGHRTSLVILDLDVNNITGPIPEFIGRFTNLRTLYLSSNNLTGHVPSEIGLLTKLYWLDLSNNHLDGLITEEHFHGLKSLEILILNHGVIQDEHLSDNQLKIVVGSEWVPPFRLQAAHLASCRMGPLFPSWLKWQVDLTYLDISSTGITDRFPDWFSSAFSKVTDLDISNNRISGALPKNMGNMSLYSLFAGSNNISGRIPQLPRKLDTLDISKNSLSGPLPSDFGAPNLFQIDLSSNYITGQIPVFVCELDIYFLDLANNLLEGELPQCFRTRGMTILVLSNNSFSGKFPPFLERCTELTFLDLARNRFSGTLPMWIGNLGQLMFLRLNNNMFYGHIPNNITSLKNLYHLNLAANEISGSIPHHLSNLTGMLAMPYVPDQVIIREFYQLLTIDMPVVTKRQELKYNGNGLLEISSIDFSCNYLNGKIPEEITSLDGLINLNLSWNQLNGGLPNKIGDMQTLESLDISNNNISGEIPSSVSNLTYLSILDLSYNHLAGRIPSGSQLDTLYAENPSMYNGNIGLCGPILHKNCAVNNNAQEPDHQQRSEEVSELMLFFYYGLGSGFVAGLWVVFIALLFKKAWRISYFRLFDKVHDKAYVFIVVTWGRLARKR